MREKDAEDFLDLPPSLRYRTGSEHEPIQFFSEALCSSTSFKLMLGFFSSSAISLLSYGFSVFLFNEGHMKLLINTAITDEDKEAFKGEESSIFLLIWVRSQRYKKTLCYVVKKR